MLLIMLMIISIPQCFGGVCTNYVNLDSRWWCCWWWSNFSPSALAEYAIILSIYTLELDKREYQINQATQMTMMMIMRVILVISTTLMMMMMIIIIILIFYWCKLWWYHVRITIGEPRHPGQIENDFEESATSWLDVNHHLLHRLLPLCLWLLGDNQPWQWLRRLEIKVVIGLKSFVLSIQRKIFHLNHLRRKFNYNPTPAPHQSDVGVKCVKLSSSDPNIVLLSPGGGRTKIQF